MVTKEHRFHGIGSLKFVYRTGKTERGQYFLVKHALNNRRKSYRIAVVVGKKTHKSAVVRNRIRRRIYEQIRLIEPQILSSVDIVIIVYDHNVADINANKLNQQITKLLSKGNII